MTWRHDLFEWGIVLLVVVCLAVGVWFGVAVPYMQNEQCREQTRHPGAYWLRGMCIVPASQALPARGSE